MNRVVPAEAMALRQQGGLVNQGLTGFNSQIVPPVGVQGLDEAAMRRGLQCALPPSSCERGACLDVGHHRGRNEASVRQRRANEQ